jgi:hypothetical protein
MLTAKRIQPGTKIRLRLIATENDLRPNDDLQDAPDDIDDIRRDRELYALFKKFQEMFDVQTDEESPATLRFQDARAHGRPHFPARLGDWGGEGWEGEQGDGEDR